MLVWSIGLIGIIPLLFFYIRQNQRNKQIKRWQKSLDLKQHALVFQKLYQHVDGFGLSFQARKKHDAIEYTYGEIEFLPFIALLSLAKPDKDTVFYDLGSGAGKAVLACAMVYPVQLSVGVELFAELHLSAARQAKQLASIEPYAERAEKIEFIQGNFLEVGLDDATLIFINSTTLLGDTWEQLCTRLNYLPTLKTVITTSKPLLSSQFQPISSTTLQMSWGPVLAYIHMRKTILSEQD